MYTKYEAMSRDTKNSNSKFYAVSIPDDIISTSEAQPLVFTSKSDALTAIKKYNGARFMEFPSYEEALKYGSQPLLSSPVQTLASVAEKSIFKSLTSQEMVSLRKTIESGDESSFLDKVWSNPRYLINSAGDGPTILQEGTRYNALHVATKFKRTNMCVSVLNTIHNVGFISELYPNESSARIKVRIKRLVDLYLNTPDKSLSETPLHFACKFGAVEILPVLLSFPECDRNKCNKYGVMAKDMICDRVSDSGYLKEKMTAMFEDSFYVPILRDIANNIQEPVIGKPCHLNVVLEATSHSLGLVDEKNNLVYCAFAGPMSYDSAKDFYKVFSKKKFTEQLSFTPDQKKQLVDICLSDSEKGLERVGRRLAKEFHVSWIEFWPKLHFWGDLSSAMGLEFLNHHLKCQQEKSETVLKSEECEPLSPFGSLVTEFVNMFIKKLPQLLNEKNKMSFFILFQSLLPYTSFMSDSSFSDEKELLLIHPEIGQLLHLKLSEWNKEYFEALKLYINTQFIYLYNSGDKLSYMCNKWRMFLCILKHVCCCQSSSVLTLKSLVCDCNWIIDRDSPTHSSYVCYRVVARLKKSFLNNTGLTDYSLNEKISMPPSVDKPFKEVDIAPPSEDVLVHNLFTDFQKADFELLASTFCTNFYAVVSKFSDNIPFASYDNFLNVLKEILTDFKPLCELKCIPPNSALASYHNELALTLMSKIENTAFDKWKVYFENTDFLNCKVDQHGFGISSTREWTHFFCVIKQLCELFDDPMQSTQHVCHCQFDFTYESSGSRIIYESDVLKKLQMLYKVKDKYSNSVQDCEDDMYFLPPDSFQFLSLSSDEDFFTPPQSPVHKKVEVFVNGDEFSDVDIDILRAVVDGEAKISQLDYPYIFSWKHMMESKLGSLLKPEDKLSCTPSSSSASIRRSVMRREQVRRILF